VAERSLGRANIAPPHPVLAVVRGQDGSRKTVLAGFALAPTWTKLRGGPPLVNAHDDSGSSRSEPERGGRTAA
jgi:putative SOS response-associated peptidase YedK